MAANLMDKSLYQLPQGIADTEIPEAELIVTIEGEEPVEEPEAEEKDFYANLAVDMHAGDLTLLGNELIAQIKDDVNARRDWEEMYKEGVKLLGLKIEQRTEPWQGACGVFHPMITEVVIRFQADTIMETFPARGPVKTQIIGKETPENKEAAQRVEDDMNWQITENMVEFRPEHERMLWNLPGTGSAFKKVYWDEALKRQTSVFVPAEDIIIPYGFTDMFSCPRVVHRMRKTLDEVKRLQACGFWNPEVSVQEAPAVQQDNIQRKKDQETGFQPINDRRPTIFEACVQLELPVDEGAREPGEMLPYIVTVVDMTGDILSIRRNWREEDETHQKRQHFVHYQYIPGYGAYGFGLFHLIGGFAKSATSILRQLVDAGSLSNLPGGLKTRGLRIKGDDTPIGPGEFRDVDIGSGAIKDNIMALPYKEPSQVLAGLLEKIVEEGRRFAATADIKISEMSNQAPVGTTLALLERTLKVMSAVQARVHYSLKQELRLIADLIKENAESPPDDVYTYDVEAPQGRRAKLSDYSRVEIIPVSDPNASTMSQRVVQWQAVQQLSQSAPDIYDLPELHREMLTVFGVKNVNKLIPTAADIKLTDPVQENQNILAGKPVKAFAFQDHESHIAVHMAAMTDPLIAQLIGQNPRAQQIMAAASAHIAEHVGFAYRVKMQTMLGMPLPPEGQTLDAQSEQALSKALAQVAPQILSQSKQIVAQQQAQQNAQDPVLQLQLQEQQTKAAEVQRKAARDAEDVRLKEEELKIKAQQAGVDPATVATDNLIKTSKAQSEIALNEQRAQEQMRLEQERAQAAQHTERVRTAADLAGKGTAQETQQQVQRSSTQMAQERHQQQLAQQREAHALAMQQKREAHKEALKARLATLRKHTGGE